MEGWKEAARFMGAAYLRYAFTKGTEQEVSFLVEALGLQPGQRVLDLGCGPGRHAHVLTGAVPGMRVVGVDLAEAFVRIAVETANDQAGTVGTDETSAAFTVGDARRLPLADGSVDAAISLCQGGFGLVGDDDTAVLDELARVLKPGAPVALSAFSAYFAVRHLEVTDEFDAAAGRNTEQTEIRSADGAATEEFTLEAACFTPREVRLLAERSGLAVEHIWSVRPGAYARRPPDLEHPEWLVIARKGRVVR